MTKVHSKKKGCILVCSSRGIKSVIANMVCQQEPEAERPHLNSIQEAEREQEVGQSCTLEACPHLVYFLL